MKLGVIVACALVAAAKVGAQAPCSTLKVVADSAREDALSILTSGRPLVVELRQEQNIVDDKALAPIRVVNERLVCARLATMFGHPIGRGTRFVVLRIGPLYYARDPDQTRGTGVITDSTFNVLMRLGAAVPGDQ